MNLRRFALLIVPVVVLGVVARVVRVRSPAVWNPEGSSLRLSADGSRLVALSDMSAQTGFRVWDVPTRRALSVDFLADKNHIVWDVLAVAPDGQAAALHSELRGPKLDEWLEVWDMAHDPVRLKWRVPFSWGTALFVDERLLVLQQSAVKTYDACGKLVSTVKLAGLDANETLIQAAFSPDGSLLVDGDNLRLYDARTGKRLRRLQNPRPGKEFGEFSFAPDGRFLLAYPSPDTSFSAPNRIVWNVSTGRGKVQKNQITDFWTAQGHGRIRFDGRVEDVWTRQKLGVVALPTHGAEVREIQTSRDGRVVVAQRPDGNVWIQEDRWF